MFNRRKLSPLRSSIALLLAASFVAGPIAIAPSGTAHAVGDPTIGSCRANQDAENSQYWLPLLFTADDVTGERLTSTTGLTFELRFADGSTQDVSEFVTTADSYANQFFYFPESLLENQFDPALSTFIPRLPTSDGFVLLCSRMQYTDAYMMSDGTVLPFEDGTTLQIKRNDSIIATTSIAQKQAWSSIGSQLGDEIYSTLYSVTPPIDCTEDGNYQLCRRFSDFYNFMIERTGQRLHPTLTYVLVASASLLANMYPELFPPILESTAHVASVPMTPEPYFCYAYFYLSLNLVEPQEGATQNTYRLSALGHGLANSLADPNNTAWPEFDSCMHMYDTELMNEFGNYLTTSMVFAYFLQTYISDIPRGLTSASVLGGLEANHVHLSATARIPWQWADGTVQSAIVGKSYSDGVLANGTPVPTYSVTSGSLPTGLTLNATTGTITGTPTQSGMFNFTISATNSVGVLSKNLSIEIATNRLSAPTIRATRRNKEVTISGRVDASFRGKRVILQRLYNDKWIRVMAIPVKANKRFSTTLLKRSVIRYRIVAGSEISRTIRK
ncbi:MAG: hypothetical protein RIR69_298 [Actinomycetota bacterium]